jgi:hypothetical protein
MATPEGEALKAISEYLAHRKHFYWRNNTGAVKTASGGFMRFGTPGSPDLIVIKDGFFIGLEVKAKGRKQSPDQKAFEEGVKAAGGEYYLVRSIDDVIQIGL